MLIFVINLKNLKEIFLRSTTNSLLPPPSPKNSSNPPTLQRHSGSHYYDVYYASLNYEDLHRMIDCTSIDFSGNEIEQISIVFSEEFQHLEVINFDKNKIKEFPTLLLWEVEGLRIFSAAYNQIEKLQSTFFVGNPHLEEVNFEHNLLKIIPSDIFASNKNLQVVKFYDNLCINSDYFNGDFDEFYFHIRIHCDGNENLLRYILKFKEYTEKLANNVTKINQSLDNNITVTLRNVNSSISISNSSNVYNETETSDLDILVTSLFWMIIPIIIILSGILMMISYVIYKKFVVYSVSAERRRNLNFGGNL